MLTNFINRLPPIDLLSFILGLFLGIFLYIVGIRVYRNIRLMSITQKKTDRNKYVTSSIKIISQYKTMLLKRAQSDHLLGALFPLSEIYTPIPLIYPYPYIDPSSHVADSIEAANLLPFVPGFSEFFGTVPYRSASLISLLRDQNLILIQGEIGTGKTTLMNSTISKIIEGKTNNPDIDELLPVYIHFSDMDFDHISKDEPFLDVLECGVFTKINCSRAMLSKTIVPYFENGKSCIFLDGLDESSPLMIDKCAQWLRILTSKYPLIRIVISLNDSYIGNLLKDGFVPYHISPITMGIGKELVGRLIKNLGSFALLRNISSDVFPEKYEYWHRQNSEMHDVFSLTLTCLYEFSLSGTGPSKTALVNNYILSHCLHNKQLLVLSKLAIKMSATPYHTLQKDSMASVFSDHQIDLDSGSGNNQSLLETLVDLGFLLERQPGTFGFRFPQVYSYLLGIDNNYHPSASWEKCFYDRSENYALASSKEMEYLTTWINLGDEPLYRHFDILGLHIEKIKNDQLLLNKVIAAFINILQQENLPLPVKLKALSLTLRLGSDSALKILDVLPSRFPNCKIFSILGYGFFNSDKSVSKIASFLSSSKSLEKALCALSLLKIDNQISRNELDKLLFSSDDLTRRIICEMYSTDRIDGHSKLKELSSNESLAIRKSSIYGIKLIDEDWVSDFLTSISIKDTEWLVRDSAAAALDELSHKILNISQFSIQGFEKMDWLVESAKKRNFIMAPKIVPTDLLMDIVNTGSSQEKYASLFILSRFSNSKVKDYLNSLLEANSECGDQVYFYLNELSSQEIVNL